MDSERNLTQIECALVIVTWNGRDLIHACLSRALAQAQVEHEVIVVDNGSSDGTAAFVREHFPDVRVIENPTNLGFAGGVNVGVRATAAPYVGLVNQDAELDRRWCRQLLQRFAADERIAVAGSKILYPDRVTLQHAGGVLRPPLFLADHRGYGQRDTGQFREVADVDYVTGAAMMVRRDVFDELGGFDEGFFPAYFEEADFCTRARAAGYRVVYEPFAVAYHRESASTVRDSEQYYRWYHRNRLRYVLKHLSTEALLNDFRPAERRRLAEIESESELRALTEAYEASDQSIQAGDVVPRGAHPGAVADARRVLQSLAEAARSRLSGQGIDPLAAYLGVVQRFWRIEERPFTSALPGVGRWVARFRQLWNDVSTTWYVRPLVDQQRAWNEGVYLAMTELAERVGRLSEAVRQQRAWVDGRVEILTQETQRAQDSVVGVDRDVVQLVRLLGDLEQRVRALERALEDRGELADRPQLGARKDEP